MSEAFDVVSYLASKGKHGRQANGPEVAYPCFFDCGESDDSRKRKLYVNAEEGFFDCKVCGASGGTTLLQRHFGDDPKGDSALPVSDSHTKRKILNWASEVGTVMLSNNDEVLLDLMSSRGLSPETVIERKIGFVGSGWSLTGSLPEQFTRAELETTGLIYRDGLKAGKDFFGTGRGHLLIPYLSRGNVVQIRGRALDPHAKAKYLTGPGEPVRLFSVDELDGATDAIITEGEFDAIVLKQHLASSPEDKVRKIAVVGLAGANGFKDGFEKYFTNVKRVFIGLDPDDTGRREAVKIKDKLGAKAKIVELPAELPKCDWSEYLLPIPPEADDAWRGRHPHAGHTWSDVMNLLGRVAGKRVFSMAEAGGAWRRQRATRHGLKTGYSLLDETIKPGCLPGQLMIILAKTGCIAGDAEIAVNRGGKGFTIKLADLVDRWEGKRYAWDLDTPTYVQREVDGQVRLGRLVNAWRSGTKVTYTVTTDTGRTIRATDEHPFLTERGWLRLDQLVVGDQVHVRGQRSSAGRKPKVTYAKRTVRHHPYAGRRGVAMGGHSVPLHRLVVEAHMNDFTSVEGWVRLLNDAERMEQNLADLRFLDPDVVAVHHIDHDHTNNDLANLKVLTHAEHAALHADEGTTRNVQVNIALERVVSVEKYGEEETFDLEVADDPHNFLANGFVVHNTGKTLLLCNLAYFMRDQRWLFFSLEMTREEVYERMQRIYRFWSPLASDDEVERQLANIWICDENRLSDKDFVEVLAEYEAEVGASPQVVAVDYLGYYARGQRGNSQYEKVTNASMQLKAMAKSDDPDKRFFLITPSQVNRLAKEGKPIDMDDARDSGAIEETADFLLSVWKPDDALEAESKAEPSGKLMLSILKSRHGGKGKTFPLQMDLLTLAIVDGGTPAARKAQEDNYLAWRGKSYDDLRAHELRPVQLPIRRDLQ